MSRECFKELETLRGKFTGGCECYEEEGEHTVELSIKPLILEGPFQE